MCRPLKDLIEQIFFDMTLVPSCHPRDMLISVHLESILAGRLPEIGNAVASILCDASRWVLPLLARKFERDATPIASGCLYLSRCAQCFQELNQPIAIDIVLPAMSKIELDPSSTACCLAMVHACDVMSMRLIKSRSLDTSLLRIGLHDIMLTLQT